MSDDWQTTHTGHVSTESNSSSWREGTSEWTDENICLTISHWVATLQFECSNEEVLGGMTQKPTSSDLHCSTAETTHAHRMHAHMLRDTSGWMRHIKGLVKFLAGHMSLRLLRFPMDLFAQYMPCTSLNSLHSLLLGASTTALYVPHTWANPAKSQCTRSLGNCKLMQ